MVFQHVYQQIELLEDKLTAAKTRLGEVVDSAEDSWEELKDRFEGVAEDLGLAFKKMFNKKS